MDTRKARGTQLALSIVATVLLAVAAPAMLMGGAAFGLVAGVIVLAILAGLGTTYVADQLLNAPAAAPATVKPHDLAA